jgi:S-DNA-T family DNA segregation ATPase FtsK/SpoIIIE
MEERYDLLHMMQVRNIADYNELGPTKVKARIDELGDADRDVPTHMPYVVVVVDELADLMMTAGKDIEVLITRLAQKSRAVGIHVVLATQRPSTDVITGLIKANLPTRLAFQVSSKIDSRVVLDQNGAEKLLGKGDMLYVPPRTSNLVRAQAAFVSDTEVKRVVEFLAERHEPQFNRELTQVCAGVFLNEDEKDELYDQAVRIVLEEQRGSASLLQRALEIGYTRSSRLLDLMRKEGIVGAYKGSKASEVLCSLEDYETRLAVAAKARSEAAAADDGGEDAEEG